MIDTKTEVDTNGSYVVIDISTSEVAIAIVARDEGERTRVVYEHSTPLSETADFGSLIQSVKKALVKSLESIPVGTGLLTRAYVFLSSPFVYTRIGNYIILEGKKPITQTEISKNVILKVRQIEDELRSLYGESEPLMTIEHAITKVTARGYPIEKIDRIEKADVSVDFVVSFTSISLEEIIRQSILQRFHPLVKVTLHAATLASGSVVRSVLHMDESTTSLVLLPHAEATEYAVLHSGRILSVGTIPIGGQTLLRKGKGSLLENKTLLKQFLKGELREGSLRSLIEPMKEEEQSFAVHLEGIANTDYTFRDACSRIGLIPVDESHHLLFKKYIEYYESVRGSDVRMYSVDTKLLSDFLPSLSYPITNTRLIVDCLFVKNFSHGKKYSS